DIPRRILEKYDDVASLAFSHLSAEHSPLLVGRPISGAEVAKLGRCPQSDDIHSSVSHIGIGVHRSPERRSALVPGHLKFQCSTLEYRDDLGGDVSVHLSARSAVRKLRHILSPLHSGNIEPFGAPACRGGSASIVRFGRSYRT